MKRNELVCVLRDYERRKVIGEVLEIINAFEKKPVRCKGDVYVIDGDELWNAIKLHLTTEIMKLKGGV